MFTTKLPSPLPRSKKSALGLLSLVCAFGVTRQGAQAQATYTADLDATLTVLPFVPPLGPNTFGFATFTGTTQAAAHDNPNPPAINSAAGLATAPTVTQGVSGQSIVSGNAEGQPNIPAHADSFGKTISKINLGNLTGGPAPTPPPQNLTFQLQLTYTYTIAASAATANDQAQAHIFLSVDAADAPFMVDDTVSFVPGPDANSITVTNTIILPDTVAPNTVQTVYLRTLADGFADCVRPPDVLPPPPPPVRPFSTPEPGSVALLAGMGAVGAGFLRRRKQANKAA